MAPCLVHNQCPVGADVSEGGNGGKAGSNGRHGDGVSNGAMMMVAIRLVMVMEVTVPMAASII